MKKTVIKVNGHKGRGVFADEDIPANSVIEKCETIIIDINEVVGKIEGYVYHYNKKKAALALGNGSLYNHSDEPNAKFSLNHRSHILTIRARTFISAGEEITLDYGYDEKNREKFRIR